MIGRESSALRELIVLQQGVVSAAQAATCGLSHETLRQRVLRGIWQRLLPGVYVLQGAPVSRAQWLTAAQLYAGEDSVLTGRAALIEYGLELTAAVAPQTARPQPVTPPTVAPRARDSPQQLTHFPCAPYLPRIPRIPPESDLDEASVPGGAQPVARFADHRVARAGPLAAPPFAAGNDNDVPIGRLDVLVPHGQRRQNAPPVHITRTTRLPAPVRLGQLRLAPLARAVIDCCVTAAARAADRTAIARILSTALADGRVNLEDLEYELARAPRRDSSALRAELGHMRAQSRATAVRQFLDGLGRSGPFGALRDVAVYAGQRRVARAAALWPTRAVAAAVDAPEHEISTLSALGFAVVEVSPRRVAEDLAGLLRHVGSVLMARPEATMPLGVSLLPLASAHEVSAT